MGQGEIARGKPGLIRWVTFTSRGPDRKRNYFRTKRISEMFRYENFKVLIFWQYGGNNNKV